MIQRTLLLIMLATPVAVMQAQVAQNDSLALVALYQATDGPNWSNNTNWLTGPVTQWFGVEVTADRVTRLDLGGNNLSGAFPMELADLTGLHDLTLAGNHLTGQLPVELVNLTSLTVLNLHINELTGEIPAAFGTLTDLTVLDLATNQLTGGIPTEIGNLPQLTSLRVRNNSMMNGMLPQSLTNLSLLEILHFDNTGLCAPTDETFQTWLQNISNLMGANCTSTASESTSALPGSFSLLSNYPNPFNLQTIIQYGLPQTASVRLSIYNTMGRCVQELVAGMQPPGWHQVVFESSDLPSGVYFYRLEAGSLQASGQMLLVR